MATEGYPGRYEKGFIINGLEDVTGTVYHMGTAEKDGNIITVGGRVLMVNGRGKNLAEARQNAMAELKKVKCKHLFNRTDIGAKEIWT
jgi:phosphoribosylamine--glycine ligase